MLAAAPIRQHRGAASGASASAVRRGTRI